MKALILDAGNSQTKLFAWAGDHQRPLVEGGPAPLLEEINSWPTPDRQGNWTEFVKTMVQSVSSCEPQPLVVSSVIPEVVTGLGYRLDDLVVVDYRSQLPFNCAQADPSAIGPDRLCNMAAAAGAGLDSALVVDVGTATTFDLLQDGVFKGGLIAPGPEFSLRCLGDRAARLIQVPFESAPLAVGTTTDEAMANGSWNTGIGGINWCIDGLIQKYGPLTVIRTGGLGEQIYPKNSIYDPHFTLRGAALLAGLLTP